MKKIILTLTAFLLASCAIQMNDRAALSNATPSNNGEHPGDRGYIVCQDSSYPDLKFSLVKMNQDYGILVKTGIKEPQFYKATTYRSGDDVIYTEPVNQRSFRYNTVARTISVHDISTMNSTPLFSGSCQEFYYGTNTPIN